MIKIIKPKKDYFTVICPCCGCKFSYEMSDINWQPYYKGEIPCPECGYEVEHQKQTDMKN